LKILIEVTRKDDVGQRVGLKERRDECLKLETELKTFHPASHYELTATLVTCAVRASIGEFTGGLASPWVELLPPLELR
jgi:hypothetical protein